MDQQRITQLTQTPTRDVMSNVTRPGANDGTQTAAFHSALYNVCQIANRESDPAIPKLCGRISKQLRLCQLNLAVLQLTSALQCVPVNNCARRAISHLHQCLVKIFTEINHREYEVEDDYDFCSLSWSAVKFVARSVLGINLDPRGSDINCKGLRKAIQQVLMRIVTSEDDERRGMVKRVSAEASDRLYARNTGATEEQLETDAKPTKFCDDLHTSRGGLVKATRIRQSGRSEII